jgi:hypothetical protein
MKKHILDVLPDVLPRAGAGVMYVDSYVFLKLCAAIAVFAAINRYAEYGGRSEGDKTEVNFLQV